MGVGIWRLDFRDFLESVDSSERFVCVFCNGAALDLGAFGVTFGVTFSGLELLLV